MQNAAVKKFVIFAGKQLWGCLFFNEAAYLQACNFFKTILQQWCFPMTIPEFLRMPFLMKRCKWPLLDFVNISSTSTLVRNYFIAFPSNFSLLIFVKRYFCNLIWKKSFFEFSDRALMYIKSFIISNGHSLMPQFPDNKYIIRSDWF